MVPLLVVPILIARSTFASYFELKAGQEQTIETLIHALEAKDRYTAGHAQRVATFSEYVGAEFAFGERRMERLRYAALMHDIGKLVVPNQLLNKPGRLTESEFERVKRHEPVSVELLRRIDFLAPVAGDTTTEAATAAVDGSGLVEPAIIHVADAFDAMTSTRAYRRALSQETAFAELRAGAGTQFNAQCVEAFIAAIERRNEHVRRRPRGRRARLGGGTAGGRHRFGRPGPPRPRGAGGGSVRRWVRLLVLLAGSASIAAGIEIADPGSRWAPLALIGGAIAAGELIELRPPLRAALPDLLRLHGRPGPAGLDPGRRSRPRDRRARRLPGPLGAGVGRGAVWRCSSSASSRAWPRSSCTTGSSRRSARHPCAARSCSPSPSPPSRRS